MKISDLKNIPYTILGIMVAIVVMSVYYARIKRIAELKALRKDMKKAGWKIK